MVDTDGEFSFSQTVHVTVDIRIDISIFIRPMKTKFESTEIRLIK